MDIFGFEIFEKNSFEQLCINYTNEHLQAHFNQHMCEMEQQLYSQENIDWEFLPFPDNSDVLRLFQDPAKGLFSLLDETCAIQKSTAKDLISKYKSKTSQNPRFYRPKQKSKLDFGVRHFAGDVVYSTDDFISKNRNSLNSQFNEAMRQSSNKTLRLLFDKDNWQSPAGSPETSAPPKSGKPRSRGRMIASVSKRFTIQLKNLVQILNRSLSMYVRCIKPNSEKSCDLFDNFDVNRQLKCAGMLEALKIRKHGFPVRIGFKEFYDKFWKLFSVKLHRSATDEEFRRVVAEFFAEQERFGKELLQMGKTRVFMKKESMDRIERVYQRRIENSVICIQKNVKRFLTRKKFVDLQLLFRVLRDKARVRAFFRRQSRTILRNKLDQFVSAATVAMTKEHERRRNWAFEVVNAHAEAVEEEHRRKRRESEKPKYSDNSFENGNFFVDEEAQEEQVELLDDLEALLEKKEQELVQKNQEISEKDAKIKKLEQQIRLLETEKTELKLDPRRRSKDSIGNSLLPPNSGRKGPAWVESIQNLNTHELSNRINQLQVEKELHGEIFSNLLTILKLKTLENKLVYKFFYNNDHKVKGMIADNLGRLKSDEKVLKNKLTNKLEELNLLGDQNYIERFSYLRSSCLRGSNVSFQRPRT